MSRNDFIKEIEKVEKEMDILALKNRMKKLLRLETLKLTELEDIKDEKIAAQIELNQKAGIVYKEGRLYED